MKYSDDLINFVYSLPQRNFIQDEHLSEQDWLDAFFYNFYLS